MRLVLSQNYFTFQNMGSTTSSTIAEILLQYFEDIHIKQLLDTKKQNILRMLRRRYLNYIWHQKAHPDLINTHIIQIHTNINLNPTHENNRCISFLDLQKLSNLENDIFHKPMNTDTNINFFSNHPIEHKIAAFRCRITRMHSLPLTPKRKQKNGH